MEIGEVEKVTVIEPLEDPVPGRERTPVPEPEREREPVRVPEREKVPA